jgi:type I restriction enzyme R subunit
MERLGRNDTKEASLNEISGQRWYGSIPDRQWAAIDDALAKLTQHDLTRSLLQHNREYYQFIRDGVPVATGFVQLLNIPISFT